MEIKMRRFLIIGTLLLSLSIVYSAGKWLTTHKPREVEDFYYLPVGRYAKLISFGYNNVLADILWMKTLAYTGEHLATDRQFKYLVSLLDAVTNLDPYFFYPYRFAGTILPWEAHDPDNAIRLLKKGLRYLPDKWLLWFLTGFVYLYFKGDYKQAAYYMGEAAKKPGRPLFIVTLASKLLTQENDADTAIKILMEIYRNTRNENVRRSILKRIKMIIAEKNFRILERAVREFKAKEGRLPRSLEELVQKGFLERIPREPFGGRYYLTPDGQVRSTVYNRRIKIYLKR